jgi:hypothetical protein
MSMKRLTCCHAKPDATEHLQILSESTRAMLHFTARITEPSGIDNLPGRDGTVRVDPVAPPPTVSGGRVGDLLAVAVQLCG